MEFGCQRPDVRQNIEEEEKNERNCKVECSISVQNVHDIFARKFRIGLS